MDFQTKECMGMCGTQNLTSIFRYTNQTDFSLLSHLHLPVACKIIITIVSVMVALTGPD